jgi:hypothetical protein
VSSTCFRRGSVVGIATGHGLDGPRIESRWERDFPRLLYNGYRLFPEGKKRPGRDADPLLPSSAVGQERVELYLYCPYGPYGLYRASVPVQGCTLPYSRAIPLLPLWTVRPVQSLSACTRVNFTIFLTDMFRASKCSSWGKLVHEFYGISFIHISSLVDVRMCLILITWHRRPEDGHLNVRNMSKTL